MQKVTITNTFLLFACFALLAAQGYALKSSFFTGCEGQINVYYNY